VVGQSASCIVLRSEDLTLKAVKAIPGTGRGEAVALCLVLCLIYGLVALILRDSLEKPFFVEWDEYLTAERSHEIHAFDSWFVPRINGRPSLEKPPLQYLAGALFMELGVDPTFAVRLVSFCYGIGLSVGMVLLLRPPADWAMGARVCWSGFVAASIFALPLMRLHATSAFLDLGQAAFFCWILVALSRGRGDGGWLLAALLAGVGTWQKTPFPLLVLLLPLAMEVCWTHPEARRWMTVRRGLMAIGLALLLMLLPPVLVVLTSEVSPRQWLDTLQREFSGRTNLGSSLSWQERLRAFALFGNWIYPIALSCLWGLYGGFRGRDHLRLSLAAFALCGSVALLYSEIAPHRYVVPLFFIYLSLLWLVLRDLLSTRRWLLASVWAVVCVLAGPMTSEESILGEAPEAVLDKSAHLGVARLLDDHLSPEDALVIAFSNRPHVWQVIQSESILFHHDRFPEQEPIRWFWIPENGPNPPLPSPCVGLVSIQDLELLKQALPGIEVLHQHKYIVIWRHPSP
jgi:4-amino-4-deoxy-L-arabinose transferase-like glycosyltransferase